MPVRQKYRVRFLLDPRAVSAGNRTERVFGRITVSVYGKPPSLSVGDTVAFISRIRPFRNFNNPGGFDYKQYMTFKQNTEKLSPESSIYRLEENVQDSDIFWRIANIRNIGKLVVLKVPAFFV